jgi:hypothetical protein
MDIHDQHGQVIPGRAKVLLQAISMIEARIRGSAVQRSENKNLNLSLENFTVPKRPKTLYVLEREVELLRQIASEPKNSLKTYAYEEEIRKLNEGT